MSLGLFGLALLTRLPFATTNLYAPDSVLYARGMASFDPFDQRPQPPGYLWYVLVLRAIDLVTHDPNRAMTIVSALAGAATVALVYLLAARLYDAGPSGLTRDRFVGQRLDQRPWGGL